jgi:hypothetical protein
MTPESWSAVAAGLSVIVAVIAGRIAWDQTKEARRTRQVDALLTLYNAHQSQDAIRARTIIQNEPIRLKEEEELSEPDESMLRAYINQLNFASILILENLVDDKDHNKAKAVFKDAVTNCWNNCENPVIKRIRGGGDGGDKADFAVKLEELAKAWQ